jgi:rSAM/selenodomain-associated transferase 2
MKPALRLSVIVPTLNEEACIGDLLGDLVALRSAGHELILVDGGSSDGTLALARSAVDLCLAGERGRARQMNLGAAHARGDVLWFLHADTRVPPQAAAALLQACASGRAWGRFDVRLSGRHVLLRLVERSMNLRSCLSGIATGDQGIFVRRDLFGQCGGFPQIALMEDVALSRALRRHARPACIRRPRLQTSSRRWEQRGVLRTILLMWRLRLAYALGTPADELARLYR